MPTGPLGAPRPLADSEIKYRFHYSISSGIGERLESPETRRNAERRVAQEADEDTDSYLDPAVRVDPAGMAITIIFATGTSFITKQDHDEIINVLDQAVKSAIDQNAQMGTEIQKEPWSISVN